MKVEPVKTGCFDPDFPTGCGGIFRGTLNLEPYRRRDI